MVADLFREFDEDQSGEIDVIEFSKALPMLGIPLRDRAQAKEIFDEFDVRLTPIVQHARPRLPASRFYEA